MSGGVNILKRALCPKAYIKVNYTKFGVTSFKYFVVGREALVKIVPQRFYRTSKNPIFFSTTPERQVQLRTVNPLFINNMSIEILLDTGFLRHWIPRRAIVLGSMSSRVFHENMFFQKKISATHHASAWGLV